MLRALVVLLLLANLGWWAWHWPPLAEALGITLEPEREPERLARQFKPELIRLQPLAASAPTGPAASASAVTGPAQAASAAALPAVCLERGPLNDAAHTAARRELLQAGVNTDQWVELRREKPGSFGLYMGRFTDADQTRRKGDELQRLGVAHETLSGGPLAPGLMLGRFASNELAQARLQQLQGRGVRTARVITLVAPEAQHTLRMEQAPDALAQRLLAAGADAGDEASRWRRCAAP